MATDPNFRLGVILVLIGLAASVAVEWWLGVGPILMGLHRLYVAYVNGKNLTPANDAAH